MVRSKQVTRVCTPGSVSTKDLAPIAPFGCPDNASDTGDDGPGDQARYIKQRPNIMFCCGAEFPRKSLPGDPSPPKSLRVKKQARLLIPFDAPFLTRTKPLRVKKQARLLIPFDDPSNDTASRSVEQEAAESTATAKNRSVSEALTSD
jgi:hypothetical protein